MFERFLQLFCLTDSCWWEDSALILHCFQQSLQTTNFSLLHRSNAWDTAVPGKPSGLLRETFFPSLEDSGSSEIDQFPSWDKEYCCWREENYLLKYSSLIKNIWTDWHISCLIASEQEFGMSFNAESMLDSRQHTLFREGGFHLPCHL